jgi:tetratricopeptide (TPR) repeat protein
MCIRPERACIPGGHSLAIIHVQNAGSAETQVLNMGRLRQLLTAVILAATWVLAGGTRAFASDEESIQRVLAAGQQAMLERHYGQAIHVLRSALKDYPADNRLRLELGRAYLSSGADSRATQLFREVLVTEPNNRLAKLELARALGFRGEYQASDNLYRELLSGNAADEAAAIGLASNLLHERRQAEAGTVVAEALALHSDSLRLQEFKDRIDSGNLGGEERVGRRATDLMQMDTDYFNDSAGNHSWRSGQRLDLDVRPGLASRVIFEQHFQHSRDDSFEAVETFTGQLRWKPREWLSASASGGAVRFNNHDVHAIYETSLAFQPMRSILLGGSFSRVPIIPNAEASEHRLTAQGWEAFGGWTGAHWRISVRGSREHYSDKNIANRQTAEAIREWRISGLNFETGYRFRHYGFDLDLAHGYFSPNFYQSHLAVVGVRFHPTRKYRGEILARGGAESAASGAPFSAAWEINVRNELSLGNWTLQLDYSRYHLLQDTGAFRAEAGRFAVAYHF